MEVIKIEELAEAKTLLDELNEKDLPAAITEDGGTLSAILIPVREHGLEMTLLYAMAEESPERYGALAEWAEADTNLRTDAASAKRGNAAAREGRALFDQFQMVSLRGLPPKERKEIEAILKSGEEHRNKAKPEGMDETDYLMSSPTNAERLERSMNHLRQGRYTERALIEDGES